MAVTGDAGVLVVVAADLLPRGVRALPQGGFAAIALDMVHGDGADSASSIPARTVLHRPGPIPEHLG